jgi:outer membrane protein assembly factor BamD (BamD/ComL family)
MKRLIILFMLLYGIQAAGYAQEKRLAKLFERAQAQLKDSAYADALNTYKQIMHLSEPFKTAYAKACYNSGYINHQIHNDSLAKSKLP